MFHRGAPGSSDLSARERAAVLDSLAKRVVYYDLDLRIRWASRAAGESVGRAPGQLIDRRCHEVWGHDTSQCTSCPLVKALEQGEPQEGDVVGSDEATWRIAANAVKDARGDIIGVVEIAVRLPDVKRVETALRVTREQLELITKDADLGLWEWNVQTGQAVFNDRWVQMLGYSRDKIEAHVNAWVQLLHPQDKDAVMAALHDHLAGRTPAIEIEYRMRAQSGQWKWVRARAKVVTRDKQGKPLGITGSHLDITELKHLRQQRDRLFKRSLDMVCVVDSDGNFRQINPAWPEALGWTEEELLSMPWFDLVLPADRAKTIAAEERLKGVKSGVRFENRYRCKDGTYRWLLWNSYPLPDEDQTFSIVRDITEQKQAQDSVREAEQRLQMLLDTSGDLLVTQTLDGRYLSYHGPARFGLEPRDLIGKTPFDFFPADEARRITDQIDEVRLSGERVTRENRATWHGETQWFCDEMTPVRDRDGHITGVIKLRRNITQRKKVELDLMRHQSALDTLVQIDQMTDMPVARLTDFVLKEGVKLTASAFGFIDVVTEADDGMCASYVSTAQTAEKDGAPKEPAKSFITQAGIHAEAVRQGAPVIVNDYAASCADAGVAPADHGSLKRFLSVPLLDEGKVIAVVTVADKTDAYTDADAHILMLLVDALWRRAKRARGRADVVGSQQRL